MTKNILMYIIVIAVVALGAWMLFRKGSVQNADLFASPSPTPVATVVSSPSTPVNLPSGLVVQDLGVGNGATAKSGDTIAVHYTGWLTTGQKFDSSVDRGEPFVFQLGAGQVIRGWDEGVQGMKVGGKRKLTIPASLGYGSQGAGGIIPPNATLLFEVELLAIREQK